MQFYWFRIASDFHKQFDIKIIFRKAKYVGVESKYLFYRSTIMYVAYLRFKYLSNLRGMIILNNVISIIGIIMLV